MKTHSSFPWISILSLALVVAVPMRGAETGSGGGTTGTSNPGSSSGTTNPRPVESGGDFTNPIAHIQFPNTGPRYYDTVQPVFHSGLERRIFGEFITSRVSLPPEAPMLGTSIPAFLRSPERGPAQLERFRQTSAESFFAPLTAVLRAGSVPSRYASRIEGYVSGRAQALAALRAALASSVTGPVSGQGCGEAELAAQEAEAEALRNSLAREVDNVRWTERGSWETASDEPDAAQRCESRFLVAVSFFQEGLSLEQRELLREMAQSKPAAGAGRVLAFSPFGSRFRLPAELSQDTLSLIAEYEVLKGGLRGELAKIVHENEGTWLEGVRVRRCEELQAAQGARFQRLEDLAERIRAALAGVALPDEPARPVLSEGVTRRLSDYLRAKESFQRTLVASLVDLRGRFPNRQIELVREDGKVKAVAQAGLGRAAEVAAAELTGRIQHDYAELERQRRSITEEIAAERSQRGEQQPASIDQLAGEFAKALMRQETWARYEDYRAAMLRPGMSARQRRLLFSAAVHDLVPSSDL